MKVHLTLFHRKNLTSHIPCLDWRIIPLSKCLVTSPHLFWKGTRNPDPKREPTITMLILSLNQVLGVHPPSTLENCHLKASHPHPPQKKTKPFECPRVLSQGCPEVCEETNVIPDTSTRDTHYHFRWDETQQKAASTGVIIVPTQTMHYYNGNPSKIPHNLHSLIPLKMGNVLPRVFMNSSLLDYCRCSFGICTEA